MQPNADWHDHCKKSEEIVSAVRSRTQLGITADQMAHVHSDAFIKFWVTSTETVRVIYRSAYPELFAPATFEIPDWLQQ